MKQPLVSAIVPVYNTTEYVEECILSILSQSYENIELILVNDGSTDGAGDICRKYEHLENVIYIENVHQGVVEARKHGVEVAHGEWIMFVDSDDLLLKEGIQQMMLFSSNVDIVVGGNTNDKLLLKAPDYYQREEYLYRLYSNSGIPCSPWGKLFKKKLIENSPLAFYYHLDISEDYIMNLAIAVTNKKKVAICKRIVYYYRIRTNSVIHTASCDFSYFQELCDIADSIVKDYLPIQRFLVGGIRKRMYYYYKVLYGNDYQGNKNDPYVKGIIRRMNQAKKIRLSDRLILSVSSKKSIKRCLIICKFIRRIENPFILSNDIKRLLHSILYFMSNKDSSPSMSFNSNVGGKVIFNSRKYDYYH